MSAENVALVRGIYDNFGRGSIAQVLAALDPAIEWVESDASFLPHRGTHTGPEAVASEVFGMVMAHFDEFAVLPQHIYDAGEQIIVEGRATGVTKAGRKLDAPAAWVWTVRGGQAVRNVNYHDTSAWREALGT
jgi:uncharacterized protein